MHLPHHAIRCSPDHSKGFESLAIVVFVLLPNPYKVEPVKVSPLLQTKKIFLT